MSNDTESITKIARAVVHCFDRLTQTVQAQGGHMAEVQWTDAFSDLRGEIDDLRALLAEKTEQSAPNPMGAQVKMLHDGRILLGDVRGHYTNDGGEMVLLVFHFNGTPWPVIPRWSDVEVLERFTAEEKHD